MSDNTQTISNIDQMTLDIFKIYNEGAKKERDTKESIERFNSQIKYEDNYKESSRVCHTDGVGSILGISVNDLSGIHKDAIIKGLKNSFYDYNFMNEIRCMMNLIIDIKDGDGESERSRIHRFISDPRRFGAPSAFNYAMRTDLISNNKSDKKHDTSFGEMVVVKCPREPSSAKELIHELCVGIRLFELRKYGCCNFSMVYDAWYCGAPVVNDKNNEVNSWCMASDSPVSYVAYEMIHDAKPIEVIAKDKTPGIAVKAAKYFMQMALAEYLAQGLAGFQHYDAHPGNLLLRPFWKEEFFIYYGFEGNEYFVPSPGEIVTFIDYGMSRVIMEDGTSVGKLDASGAFKNSCVADPDDGDVLGDIYKLMCALLNISIYYNNNELSIFLGRILNDFFYRDQNPNWNNLKKNLNDQKSSVYLLPPKYIREKGLNISDFINYLRSYTSENYNVELMHTSAPEGAKIFGHSDHFKDEPEIKKEIGLEIAEIPTLYDLSISILSSKGIDSKIMSNVSKNIITVLHNELISINSILNNNNRTGVIVLESGRINIEHDKEYTINAIEIVAKVIDNCYKIGEKIKSYKVCLPFIDNPDLNVLIDKCNKFLNSNISYIERIKSTLVSNKDKIKNAMKEQRNDFVFIKRDQKAPNGVIGVYEGEDPPVDPLFNLMDKYETTINNLKSIFVEI